MNAWRRCNHFVQSLSRLETPHREIGPAFSCALWLKMSFSNVEMRMKSGFWIQTLWVILLAPPMRAETESDLWTSVGVTYFEQDAFRAHLFSTSWPRTAGAPSSNSPAPLQIKGEAVVRTRCGLFVPPDRKLCFRGVLEPIPPRNRAEPHDSIGRALENCPAEPIRDALG